MTALKMALYPVADLYAGALFFSLDHGADVLHAWRRWTDTVPDEMTSLGRILRLPAVDEIPAALRGRAFALVEAAYLGAARAGAELLGPLRELGPERRGALGSEVLAAPLPFPRSRQSNADPSTTATLNDGWRIWTRRSGRPKAPFRPRGEETAQLDHM